jgi:hypothetical protein
VIEGTALIILNPRLNPDTLTGLSLFYDITDKIKIKNAA